MKISKREVFNVDARLSVKFSQPATAQPATAGAAAVPAVAWSATLGGYALTWDTLSDVRCDDDGNIFKVRLSPGSASFAVPTLALYHHDYTHVLGNKSNGTLRIYPDDVGVRVEIDLPDKTSARDVATLVERKDVTGMSFSMIPGDQSEATEDGMQVVTCTRFLVDEVTVTAIPAFTSTSISVMPATAPIVGGGYAAELNAEAVKLERHRLGMYAM